LRVRFLRNPIRTLGTTPWVTFHRQDDLSDERKISAHFPLLLGYTVGNTSASDIISELAKNRTGYGIPAVSDLIP